MWIGQGKHVISSLLSQYLHLIFCTEPESNLVFNIYLWQVQEEMNKWKIHFNPYSLVRLEGNKLSEEKVFADNREYGYTEFSTAKILQSKFLIFPSFMQIYLRFLATINYFGCYVGNVMYSVYIKIDKLHEPLEMQDWVVIVPKREAEDARRFIGDIIKVSKPMKFGTGRYNVYVVISDKFFLQFKRRFLVFYFMTYFYAFYYFQH